MWQKAWIIKGKRAEFDLTGREIISVPSSLGNALEPLQ
jgi:hypothetical protein